VQPHHNLSRIYNATEEQCADEIYNSQQTIKHCHFGYTVTAMQLLNRSRHCLNNNHVGCAAGRYTSADRGGSTSVRGRIRSPHSSGGLQGSCGAAGLGAVRLCQVGQTDGRIAASLNAPPPRRRHNNAADIQRIVCFVRRNRPLDGSPRCGDVVQSTRYDTIR